MKRLLFSLVVCLGTIAGTFQASGQAPTDYDALVHQGNAQLQAGSNDLALATANSAIKLNADRWEAYALAGGALMNLRRYDEAISRLTEAMDRAPQDKQTGLRELRKQCFAAEAGAAPGAPPSAASANAPPPEGKTTQAEIVLWKSIENSTNPADFRTYLDQYPNGAFAALAQRHLSDAQKYGRQQQQLLEEQAEELDLNNTVWVKYPELQGNPQEGSGTIWVFQDGKEYRADFDVHLSDTKHPKRNHDNFTPKLAEAKAVVSGQLEISKLISDLGETGTYTIAPPANVTITDSPNLGGCKGPGEVYALTVSHGEMSGSYAQKSGGSTAAYLLNPFSWTPPCDAASGTLEKLQRLGRAGEGKGATAVPILFEKQSPPPPQGSEQ